MSHPEVKKSRGQLAMVPIVLGGIFTLVGSYFTATAAANKELYETKLLVQKNDSALSERLTKQETILPRVESKVDDLGDDIKDIKKALNIK